MKAPNSNLRRIIDAWHDGTITPDQARDLEQLLLRDPDARRYFFDITAIEVSMAGALQQLPKAPALAQASSRTSWWRMAAVFVLGGVCGGAALKALAPHPARTATAKPAPAATVTGMLGVAWDGLQAERSVNLTAGMPETSIGSGLLELTFASGTRAVIEGPAAFQVLGDNAIHLSNGKLVADVPKGAEGFSVDYADGKIVDLGTEFGIEVMNGGRSATFGVFRGEIEFRPEGSNANPIRLLENHAMEATEGGVATVPFAQEKFTRKLPSREFAWQRTGTSQDTQIWDYDVSHLVWSAGNYRVICKWMQGRHGISIDGAEFLCDGEPVAADRHAGSAGDLVFSQLNCYNLSVPPDRYHRGRWTLRIKSRITLKPGESADSAGVILVESGIALKATAADFIGVWEYLHNGGVYQRTFLPDGTAKLTINGKPTPYFADARWEIQSGSLVLKATRDNGIFATEYHHLRTPDTLVFANCPYNDAKRVKK